MQSNRIKLLSKDTSIATCLREGGDKGGGEQGLGQLAKVLLEQARNVEAARVRVEGCRLQ